MLQRGSKTVAIVADRIQWEERALLREIKGRGISAVWTDDGQFCVDPDSQAAPQAALYLIRSRSYVRGLLLSRHLEMNGCRVINSAFAIELCANKAMTLARLQKEGVSCADFRLVLSRRDLDRALSIYGVPIVLKPVFGGLGRRVLLVSDAAIAHSIYDYVEHSANGLDNALLAQPFYEGDDIRAVVVGDRCIAAARRVKGADWRGNAAAGGFFESIEIDQQMTGLVADVVRCLGSGIYGIDLFRRRNGYLVSEVNHALQFRAASSATGIEIGAAIVSYLMEQVA